MQRRQNAPPQHNSSPQTAKPRLFGSRKDAFTGTVDSEGLLAEAEGGTVLIDELGDMELRLQASMLRAIQERTITPVGSTKSRRVDFALCAATKVDLEEAIKEGRFRDDLMGRLEQRVVTLDGLDRRRDEIPLLIELIAKRFDPNAQIDGTFVEACLLASWPRNIRQLEAVVDDAASAAKAANRAMVASDVVRPSRPSSIAPPPFVPAPVVDDPERAAFVEAYRRCGGDSDAVCKELAISRSTFFSRKKKYGIGPR
jgi:transcriptional regulator of acetoin/glycerol metabolism